MASKKITRKIRYIESDDSIYIHEWTSDDNSNYASTTNFYLTYSNVNYYFSKPNEISIGGKFEFNTSTKVLKYNNTTISTSTTGSGATLLDFVASHKWSDAYINIGANAENVFLENDDNVQDFIDNTMQIYMSRILLSSSSSENTFEKYRGKHIMFSIDNTVPCFLETELFPLNTEEYPYSFTMYINKTPFSGRIGAISPYEFHFNDVAYTGQLIYGSYPNNQGNGWHIKLYKLYYHSDYIDEHLGGNYVDKRGDTMTGPLTTTELSVGTRLGNSAGANSATVGYSGAIGIGAFSQGYSCGANGNYSHAEGYFATTYGDHSHAEGYQTIASGDFSHAEGRETQTYGGAQHVEGIYNIVDTSANTPTGNNYVHIVGNGNNATKSNAHTLDWSGNAWFAGDVYTGSTSGTNKDSGSKKLATEEYVETNGGKIDSISIDGRTQTIDANKNVDLTGLEKTFNKVTSLSDSSTDDQYPTAKAVYNEITSKISSVYKAKGTCTFANKPALNANNEGFVYNISDAFTTTSDFVEGSGKSYPAGTNIVVINNSTTSSPGWKYDVLAGMTDLSGYVLKSGDTMTGALTTTALTVGSRTGGSSIGTSSTVEGYSNIASANYSHAEGTNTEASSVDAHAEGFHTKAAGTYAHAEGQYTEVNGSSAHAEGDYTRAKGNYSHSEGLYTLASGAQSHTEGGSSSSSSIVLSGEAGATVYTTTATGNIRVGSIIKYNNLLYNVTAVVANTSITVDRTLSSDTALENVSIYFYNSSSALGTSAHAENISIAKGNNSHSEGQLTIATSLAQHVQGRYNIEDTTGSASAKGTYAHIVGNGTGETARSNAHTLDWNGNAWFKGNVYVGGTNQTTGSKQLATLDSPALTGTPTAPTAASTTNSTQIATTAFVTTKVNTKQNKITYSTTDLTAGSSALAEGEIYLVYEA